MDEGEDELEWWGKNEGEEDEGTRPASIISYHSEDFISKPRTSSGGTIPLDFLQFDYSFGYDCRRRFNLCAADSQTLIFASGNLIHFLSVSSGELTFRRCSTGGGVGHITKNPKFNHIAVGENGLDPPIIIYEWPSMEIVTVLRKGTTRSYSHLRYSPNGLQLVSQGGNPDYLITVWDWQSSKIALQCKSHGQDVYNVTFSETMPDHMTSCGCGHIKVWKMAKTFTGLKLQGELGRFGKTEISDIVGVYQMPDEKVISGCEWGNILVWDEGLIKIEVCRKNRRPCHSSYISQFEYVNGELISVGSDGLINFWFYETIDQAEPTEESNFVEVEPIYEFRIGSQADDEESPRRAMLMQILKRHPDDVDDNSWFAQDGNGGIWLIDLSIMPTPKPSLRLLTCHAGPVMDMDVADWGPFAATIGADGCMHIYNYHARQLNLAYEFLDAGRCIIWLACSVEPSGSTLICAFDSGVVRMVNVDIDNKLVTIVQALKPHTASINRMTINSDHSLLVTASEDSSIFAFHIQIDESHPNLVPIGYVQVPSCVTFMTWKPNHLSTIFLGCLEGDCVQVELPQRPQPYTKISYKLSECKPTAFKFESVKSSIIREQARQENERLRQEKIAEKKEELQRLLEANPNLEIDEQVFLESELEEEPALPEIYIPDVPNRVLAGFYTTRDTLLLSMAGYDAGYTYEYSIPEIDKETKHVASHLVADCGDQEIQCCLFYNDRKYVVLGMERGEIRVCRLDPRDEADLSDYWILPMHDCFNGRISSMRLSYDRRMLLTCGYDGNIFSFFVNDALPAPQVRVPEKKFTAEFVPGVADIEEPDHPSLEQMIVKAEEDRIMAQAKAEKEKTLAALRELTEEYNSILKRNSELPASQRLTEEELELDPRITKDLNDQLDAEMDVVRKKLAYDLEKCELRLKKLMGHFVEPITCLPFAVRRILKPDTMVHSLRELKLTGDYAVERDDPSKKLTDLCQEGEPTGMSTQPSPSLNESTRTAQDSDSDDDKDDATGEGAEIQAMESFLKGLSPKTVQCQLGEEINQMLKKYRALKAKLEEQQQEWKALQSRKPDPTAVDPEDEAAVEHARNTIGDCKLKTALSSDGSASRPSVASKHSQIIHCRRKIHFRREEFNGKLRELRARKVALRTEVEGLTKRLKNIHAELPEQWTKPAPEAPNFDYELEFPERNLEMEDYTSMAERVKQTKRRKQSVLLELQVDEFDEEYEALLLDETRFKRAPHRHVSAYEEARQIRITVPPDALAAAEQADNGDSKIEREMKRMRAARKSHEQDRILEHIERSYASFDEELDEMEKRRLDIVHESVYTDLFLLTMHQELMVLKRFEGAENQLSSKVNDRANAKNVVRNKMQKLTDRVDERNATIRRLQERIKEAQARYLNSIKEDKFFSFLKRICKKKWKPSKRDDESSSESSSADSDSEDDSVDDQGSDADSHDMNVLPLDENNCPDGCDRDLYEEAFAVRSKRYDLEHRIKDHQKTIENLQQELDSQRKALETIESELKTDTEQLQALLREKQRQLNDIDVTVVLKLHQLQCFTEEDKAEKIQNCIVFDKDKLSQLYARVGELQQETADQLARHKSDKSNLHTMKLECEAVRKELEALKQQIKEEMQHKFGQQVSLVTLYEAVLRRLIYDIKANTGSLIKFYDRKIKSIKVEYKQQLQVLKDLIQENTEKINFLTVLEEELFKLRKNLDTKLMSEEEITKLESQYEADLTKLKTLLRNQEKEKEWLYMDIISLTNKTKNLVPLDQLKSKTCMGKYKPTLTLFDRAEKQGAKHRKHEDDASTSNEARELLTEDVDYYKKIIAIRHLLSQVATVDETNTRATIEKMLTEIAENLKRAGCCQEDIEKNISEIIDISHEGEETAEVSSQDTITKSLSDLIYRYDAATMEVPLNFIINEQVRERINDLCTSVGILDTTGHVIQSLINKLKAPDNMSSALQYIFHKLPTDTDKETLAALRRHIRKTLKEIMIGLDEDESREDEC
ncbi:cilia- and flagella-associated protein 44 [Phymastichus coffea]|uniref:cilia- and flagella-associated protein 44 n=1 Tax=Phymastichus coffea TaxID=108790 RepID=UPI00273B0BB9|nr:cilia- and flagella-associated protein 44 [Phymastichus coffea]